MNSDRFVYRIDSILDTKDPLSNPCSYFMTLVSNSVYGTIHIPVSNWFQCILGLV